MILNKSPKIYYETFAKKIDADFECKKAEITMGDEFNQYNLYITKEYKGINIKVSSGYSQSPGKHQEYYIGRTIIKTEIEEQKEFYLYIWRKGLFSKLFNIKLKTGHRNFDSVFNYKTNRKKEIKNFFSNYNVRTQLLKNEFYILNIQYTKGVISIYLRMIQSPTKIENLNIMYNDFLLYIDELINSKLISTSSHHK